MSSMPALVMLDAPLASLGHDPFVITGPAVISFSGGRTSAYMLWRILQAHQGTLPDDVLVCFANTGREHPKTLDFVANCQAHWGVPVHWLEYRRDESTGRVYAEEVGHNSASRNGEPFRAMLRAKKMLPNPVMRFCTTELKVRTIRRWCDQLFGKATTWTQVVGLRADEQRRVMKMLDPKRQKKASKESRNVLLPLNTAGITKAQVLTFFARQNFDLEIPAHEGNCDGCFLKRKAFIARLYRTRPEAAQWWADAERDCAGKGMINPQMALFRKDWKGGYAAIGAAVIANPELPLPEPDPDDDGFDLFAACDAGCGV